MVSASGTGTRDWHCAIASVSIREMSAASMANSPRSVLTSATVAPPDGHLQDHSLDETELLANRSRAGGFVDRLDAHELARTLSRTVFIGHLKPRLHSLDSGSGYMSSAASRYRRNLLANSAISWCPIRISGHDFANTHVYFGSRFDKLSVPGLSFSGSSARGSWDKRSTTRGPALALSSLPSL